MAYDQGPRHTMTVFSRFWLSRPVERAEFVAAVARVARDNPLLAARPQGGSWLPLPFDPEVQIDWDEADEPVSLRHLSPDDMLVRWTVRVGTLGELGLATAEIAEEGLTDSRGTLVVLRFPHAISDALGAVALMRQVCAILAGRPVPPPSRGDLDGRHTLRDSSTTWRRVLPQQVKRVALCFSRRPAEFAPDRLLTPAAPLADVACERVVASGAETAGLRAGARAAGVSLNDLLLTALYRALAPHMDPRDVIRIAVPVSLRGAGNAAFCNQVSMVFLDRASGRTPDATLLRGVSAEMTHIKQLKLGRAMHIVLGLLHRAGSGLLWGTTRLPLIWATAVLSNLGDALAADDGRADGVRIVAHDALPPLRPGTSLALLASGHGGRLGLTLRFAPDRVSRERAATILGQLLAEAATLANRKTPTG